MNKITMNAKSAQTGLMCAFTLNGEDIIATCFSSHQDVNDGSFSNLAEDTSADVIINRNFGVSRTGKSNQLLVSMLLASRPGETIVRTAGETENADWELINSVADEVEQKIWKVLKEDNYSKILLTPAYANKGKNSTMAGMDYVLATVNGKGAKVTAEWAGRSVLAIGEGQIFQWTWTDKDDKEHDLEDIGEASISINRKTGNRLDLKAGSHTVGEILEALADSVNWHEYGESTGDDEGPSLTGFTKPSA